MARTRSDKPIALGTWSARNKLAPVPDGKKFEPVDTSPPGSALTDAVDATAKNNADIRSGQHPGVVIAKHAVRLIAGARREQARQAPQWSVNEAADAAQRFLGNVAAYCLGQQKWGLAAEAPLVMVIPELADPLRKLDVARKEMQLHSKFRSRSEASELTTHALEAAQQISQLVDAHYRAFPAAAAMPWVAVRVTGAQRARAVDQAVKLYDRLVEGWYDFVFSSSRPSSRQAQLDDIDDELHVGDEITACETQRQRCREMADSGMVTQTVARKAVKNFKSAISAFEEAVYRAVTSVPASDRHPPEEVGS